MSDDNPGRGYRYYPDDVLYEFGYGLSYTTFNCNNLVTLNGNNISQVKIDVTNTGKVNSGAVVLIFWAPIIGGQNGTPLKRLIGFERVNIVINEYFEKT